MKYPPTFRSFAKTGWFDFPRTVDDLFDQFQLNQRDDSWSPRVDVSETDAAFFVRAEIPSVRPEDIDVRVENQVLTIAGEKRREEKQEGESWTVLERSHGSFARSFRLPAEVDAESIEARAEHGVLTVRLPKQEKAVPRKIDIKTQ